MGTKSFGYRADGTLVKCSALPENRGKGRCTHGAHEELTEEVLKTGFLQRHNEEALEKHYDSLRALGLLPRPNAREARNTLQEPPIPLEELEKGANEVADKFRDKDFSFIQKVYDEYEEFLPEKLELKEGRHSYPSAEDMGKHMLGYLESESPTAKKLREFLGEDVDLNNLSLLLVSSVGGMTAARRWRSNGNDSIARAFLTSLGNDMNKKRYVASVLYFGGRCCYCNAVLSKNPKSAKGATGEHITPLTPKDGKGIVGGTRYGNMALACSQCNKARGNTELKEWVRETRLIRKADKANVLGRIQAFREFALYEDYSPEESERLLKVIEELKEFSLSLRDEKGEMPEDGSKRVRNEIGAQIYRFQSSSEHYS